MKKTILGIFFSIPSFIFAQEAQSVKTPSNMQSIEWGTESHVIPCSNFSISRPAREIVLDNPVVVKEKKMSDKRDMPVQTFVYNAKDHGEAYGTDRSAVQSEPGNINAQPKNKALQQNWAGQAPTVGFRPYDPSGAAGPNHYVQAINGDTYRVWTKTGTLIGTYNISALFSPAAGDGDPIVLYDKAADRWFISQFAGGGGGNGIYIAISQTPDPTGAYYTYSFTSPDFPDYLKFSAWQDGYYMTANFAQKIFAFNRTKMLAGDPTAEAVYQTFSPPQSGFFVPLPADASDGTMPGAGTPCPVFSYSDNGWGGGNIDAVNIYNASVNWSGTPILTVTSAGTLPTVPFDASYNASWNDIPQPGTTQRLDGIGGAMMFRAQWKPWAGYNTVVLNWAVQVSASQRGIFWCELRQDQSTNAWSIYQQGIYAPGTDYYWMGSIAMNDAGDIGLSYAKASSSTYMSLGYAGRHASDPLGTLPIAEVIAIAGTGSQTGVNRVGDYAQTTLDPDGQTFWHTGEYIGAGGSPKTRVYSYTFASPCTPPTTQASNYSASAIQDNQMTISWTNGSGDRRIVLVHEGAVVDANPGSGNTYVANSTFGLGDLIGGANYVVYDGTGTSVTVTGLTPGTDYHYSVFEYNSIDNCYLTPALTGMTTTTGVAPCAVCNDVTANNDDATGNTEVIFNTISNVTVGDPAYVDFTSISTDVNINQTYTLSVKVNTAGNYTTSTKAWIDWNQNCVFTDPGEEYDLGSATNVANNAPSLSPVSITVPATATIGNTIMRVRTTWDGGTSVQALPCGNQNYSEAEDYTINVVNPSSPPIASFTSPSAVCVGTSVNFTDASTGATSWSWDFGDGSTPSTVQNPTYTYASSGTYTVTLTVTNANGSDVTTGSITINVLPTIDAGLDQTVCAGTQVTLAGSGGATYTWDNGVIDASPFTPTATTTYTVTGTDVNGCSNTDQVVVNVNPLPNVSATPTSIGLICQNADPITLVGNPSGGTFSGNGVTGSTFDPSAAGIGNQTITYSYTDANGCTNTTTITAQVDACAGIEEQSLEGVELFPSPNDGHFVITGLDQGTEYSIYDANGRLIVKDVVNSDPTNVTLPIVETGVYYLQSTKNGKEGRIKFLITK